MSRDAIKRTRARAAAANIARNVNGLLHYQRMLTWQLVGRRSTSKSPLLGLEGVAIALNRMTGKHAVTLARLEGLRGP